MYGTAYRHNLHDLNASHRDDECVWKHGRESPMNLKRCKTLSASSPAPFGQGRELAKGKTIQDCGVNASDPVIFVRKVLVAEGARVVTSNGFTQRKGQLITTPFMRSAGLTQSTMSVCYFHITLLQAGES